MGAVAVVIAGAALGATAAITGGSVPAWLLPAVGLIAMVAIVALAAGFVRSETRLEIGHATALAAAAEREADARITLEHTQQELTDLKSAERSLREHLAAAETGQQPLSRRAQGLIRRARALLPTESSPYTITNQEDGLVRALLEDATEIIGETRALVTLRAEWQSSENTYGELRVTLEQLEAITTDFGLQDL